MAVISTLLFENVWLLLVTLVAIQFTLIAFWSWRRTRRSARAVWAGFAAVPVLLLLSIVVVTPRERIIGLCRDLAVMVDEGNVVAIREHLAEDFEAAGMNRDEFLDRVEQTLTLYHVDDARLRGFDITLSRNVEAVAVFNAVCRVRSVDAFLDRLISRWRLTFSGAGRIWRITRIETIPTPFSPIHDLRDWLR